MYALDSVSGSRSRSVRIPITVYPEPRKKIVDADSTEEIWRTVVGSLPITATGALQLLRMSLNGTPLTNRAPTASKSSGDAAGTGIFAVLSVDRVLLPRWTRH